MIRFPISQREDACFLMVLWNRSVFIIARYRRHYPSENFPRNWFSANAEVLARVARKFLRLNLCRNCTYFAQKSNYFTSSDPHHDIRFVTGKSSGILSDISSGIRSGIPSGILSGISVGILSGISFGILSGISSGILFYLANLLACYLAYLLAFYLAYLLAFYLTFYLALYLAYLLAFYLAVEVHKCPLTSGRSQVEVQWCPLTSEGPGLRSTGAHWARNVPY